MKNPFYNEVIQRQGTPNPTLKDFVKTISVDRDRLVRKYAWAIPSDEAIQVIASLSSEIVEIGAGTGYWGRLLREAGVTIWMYDRAPRGEVVREGGPESIEQHPSATLFLCWPPYASPMAQECLDYYMGKWVIYVGEGGGGCTGDDAFHETLEREFELDKWITIPQFWGLHDRLMIYRRMKSEE